MNNLPTQKVSGFSTAGIEKLMTDIVDYAERMNQIFNSVTDLVDGTSRYFVCESGTRFREQFDALKTSFPVVNRNILNYNTDLLAVKTNYDVRNQAVATQLYTSERVVDSKIGSKGGK